MLATSVPCPPFCLQGFNCHDAPLFLRAALSSPDIRRQELPYSAFCPCVQRPQVECVQRLNGNTSHWRDANRIVPQGASMLHQGLAARPPEDNGVRERADVFECAHIGQTLGGFQPVALSQTDVNQWAEEGPTARPSEALVVPQ